jgi:hypothetical protein
MSLLQEATLDRLWAKYEHRFGHPPPIDSADFEEAIAIIRKELASQAPRTRKAISHDLSVEHGLTRIDVAWPLKWR